MCCGAGDGRVYRECFMHRSISKNTRRCVDVGPGTVVIYWTLNIDFSFAMMGICYQRTTNTEHFRSEIHAKQSYKRGAKTTLQKIHALTAHFVPPRCVHLTIGTLHKRKGHRPMARGGSQYV